MTDPVNQALAHLDASWDSYLAQLVELSRIPSVSADAPPSAAVAASARKTKELFEAAGLEGCKVIEFPGGHPYVYGEWLHAPGAPTVLLYGHHDVQPPGRPEKWETPAFEPTLRRDGRLYGRGVVDDKAGVLMHVAACGAYLRTAGKLPVNVKFIVEGEEETGSESLEPFLREYQRELAADVLVLTDTSNYDAGIPSITYALRGIVGIRVEVQALDHPVHSGMWGGPVPDPVIALCKAIGELMTDEGTLNLPVWGDVRPLDRKSHQAIAALPFSEKQFREQVGLVEGATLIGDQRMPVWGRVWRQPAVTVLAFEARPFEGSTNQIIESARARISVRIVPDQDPKKVQDAMVRHFEMRVPWGLKVKVEREHAAGWWMTEPNGPAFDAAARAMSKAYGRDCVFIGCGGSIPFVDPFAKVLGGVPALLMGVEDPTCNAHSENESLNVDDWKNGTRAAVYLYDELSRLPPRPA
ncbi:MAG: M20/M25/M40 family metallo-hydrolase [bacterium]